MKKLPYKKLLIIAVSTLLTLHTLQAETNRTWQGRPILQNGNFKADPKIPLSWVTRSSADYGVFRILPATGQKKSNILFIDIFKKSDYPWILELRQTIESPLYTKEKLYLSFEYKTTPNYTFNLYWQEDTDPWFKLASFHIGHTQNNKYNGQWQKFAVIIPVLTNLKANASSLSFHLGTKQGILQLRNIQLKAYPKRANLSKLETTIQPVVGGDYYDQTWFTNIEKKMKEIHKTKLTITINHNNKPVEAAQINLKQISNDLNLGVTINILPLLTTSLSEEQKTKLNKQLAKSKNAKELYQQTILTKSIFTTISPTNLYNWATYRNTSKTNIDEFLSITKKQNLTITANTALPLLTKTLPTKLKNSPNKLINQKYQQLLDEYAQNYQQTISLWNIKGVRTFDTISQQLFMTANKKLKQPNNNIACYNRNALTKISNLTINNLLKTIKKLKQQNCPPQAICLGANLHNVFIGPHTIEKRLKRIAKETKLPIYITNFTIAEKNPQVQAEIFHKLLTLFYSIPQVKGVNITNIWQPLTPPQAIAIYDEKMQAKPAAKIIEKLILKQWKTNIQTITNKNGKIEISAFNGKYELIINNNGNIFKQQITLPVPNNQLTINLNNNVTIKQEKTENKKNDL